MCAYCMKSDSFGVTAYTIAFPLLVWYVRCTAALAFVSSVLLGDFLAVFVYVVSLLVLVISYFLS